MILLSLFYAAAVSSGLPVTASVIEFGSGSGRSMRETIASRYTHNRVQGAFKVLMTHGVMQFA